ncbi:TfuA-like protein [Actinomadura sp. GTD37]|uniref:TfuA-like protein n=1 Tax=Actinomadura sp. GTD37 TaxID=1778030 RepID=UPI0035BF1175
MVVLPPVRRGDVAALIEGTNAEPGDLVIVDGRFGDVLAVGHREILAALDAGWRVWGLASMGAIRAAELSSHGMRGFGVVYRRFADQMIPDDEVAVLHGPAPDYRPLSEAMIDLRSFLGHLAGRGILQPQQADEVAALLASRWFGERTTAVLVELCGQVAGPHVMPGVREALQSLARHRVKSADLLGFFHAESWRWS